MNNPPLHNKFLSLPIYQQKHKIIKALQEHQVIVVESNTGSGKTTQIPLILLEQGYGKDGLVVGMTEPRRIAAISVSHFIQSQIITYPSFLESLRKEELNSKQPLSPQHILSLVGYKIRFEDNTQAETKIKIMTDGILLQELKKDPYLSHYSVIIIDEAHERSLNIDFILGLLRELCSRRNSLKIIISSATINTSSFSQFFFDCPIINIESPTHSIQTHFLPPPQKNNVAKKRKKYSTRTLPQEHVGSFEVSPEVLINHVVEITKQSLKKQEGDILIFLPGEKQIKNCIDALNKLPNSHSLHILPLYGRLDNRSQELVFAESPKHKTKIIVATNIAETSITIDTIKVVIDTGRVKLNTFHHDKYISTLDEIAISQASAIQRRGRAGRTSSGICYYLYQKKEFETLEAFSKEEIHRTNLSEVVLRMAFQGIQNFERFPLIAPPKKQLIHAAIEMLQELDALDKKCIITNTGNLMSEFPLIPIHARMLVEGIQHYPKSLNVIITVISFLSTPNPFLLPMGEEAQARRAHRSFSVEDNDFLTYIRIFQEYTSLEQETRELFCQESYLDTQVMQEIYNVQTQMCNIVSEKGIPIGDEYNKTSIICAIARGLVFNICVLDKEKNYRNRKGEKIYIHPGSMLFESKKLSPIIVAGELVQTSKKFARAASTCRLEWIQNINPNIYQELQDILNINKQTNRKSPSSRTFHKQLKFIAQKPDPIPEIQKNNSLCIAKKTYTLQSIQNKTILPLTWKETKRIAKKIQSNDLSRFGRIRCLITLKKQMQLSFIKLSNIPLLYQLEKLLFPTHSTIPPGYSPTSTEQRLTHIIKTQNTLIDTCMSLYIKQNKPQENTEPYTPKVFFCSLETGKFGSYHINISSHFLTSLYNSMRSLEILIEEQQNKKLISKAQKRYSQLRNAYRLLE